MRGDLTPFFRRSLLVFLIGLGSRLFFVVFGAFEAGDSSDYHGIALNLLAGNGFAIYDSSPTVYRSPGYPLFLAGVYALFGPDPEAALILQALLGGVAGWVVYLLGRRVLGERGAFVGGLFAAAYPHLAFYAGTVLAESLSYLLLAGAIFAASMLTRGRVRPLVALTVGALMAATALSAPRLAALPVGLAVALVVQRFGFRELVATLALVAVGYSATLAPWIARNAAVFGELIPFNLGHQGLVLWEAAIRRDLYSYRYREMAKSYPLMERYVFLYLDHPERERELFRDRIELESDFTREAILLIAADPIGYAASRVAAYPHLWIQPAIYAGNFVPPFEAQNHGLNLMLAQGQWLSALVRVASILVFTVGFFGGAMLGMWRLRRRWRHIALIVAPVLVVAVYQAPLVAEQRYSVLVHPFLWLIAGVGLAEGWSSLVARMSVIRGSSRSDRARRA